MPLKPLPIPWQPIFPSQRAGEPTLEYGFWQGEERRFVLQWYEDRVYFQLADGEPTLWATVDACEESEVVSCWQEALSQRRFGLCITRYHHIARMSYDVKLQMIGGVEGDCQVRHWFSRTWIPFHARESRAWVHFPDLWELPRRRAQRNYGTAIVSPLVDAVADELMMHRFSDADIEYLAFRSPSNENEFKSVLRWLVMSGLLNVQNLSLSTGSHFQKSLDLSRYWMGQPELRRFLESHFAMQGYEFARTGWGKRQFRRLRCREPNLWMFFEPRPVYWFVSLSCELDATFHEQMEARFELRDWLRARIPNVDCESWLAPRNQT